MIRKELPSKLATKNFWPRWPKNTANPEAFIRLAIPSLRNPPILLRGFGAESRFGIANWLALMWKFKSQFVQNQMTVPDGLFIMRTKHSPYHFKRANDWKKRVRYIAHKPLYMGRCAPLSKTRTLPSKPRSLGRGLRSLRFSKAWSTRYWPLSHLAVCTRRSLSRASPCRRRGATIKRSVPSCRQVSRRRGAAVATLPGRQGPLTGVRLSPLRATVFREY